MSIEYALVNACECIPLKYGCNKLYYYVEGSIIHYTCKSDLGLIRFIIWFHFFPLCEEMKEIKRCRAIRFSSKVIFQMKDILSYLPIFFVCSLKRSISLLCTLKRTRTTIVNEQWKHNWKSELVSKRHSVRVLCIANHKGVLWLMTMIINIAVLFYGEQFF